MNCLITFLLFWSVGGIICWFAFLLLDIDCYANSNTMWRIHMVNFLFGPIIFGFGLFLETVNMVVGIIGPARRK